MKKNKTKQIFCLNKKLITALAVALLSVAIVFAFQYSHYGSSLAGGAFNETLYNGSGEFVHLNWTDTTNTTYVTNGTYVSAVIDFGNTTSFRRLEWNWKPRTCPGNMSYIDKLGGFCIDKYEASCWNADGTWNSTSNSSSWTATSTDNALADSAYAGSSAGKYPWVYISQTEARTACGNAGKYLCKSEEWLAAANMKGKVYNLPTGADLANAIPSGASDSTACVTYENADCDWETNGAPGNGDACMTGSHTDCVSSEGVYDQIGNVWEWTNETVTTYCPCDNCASTNAYCYPSDSGWQNSANAKYGNDGVYFLAGTSDPHTGRAVLRGGGWLDGASAGVFHVLLYTDASYTYLNIGFRCCSVPS